jgi:hypothetical protein
VDFEGIVAPLEDNDRELAHLLLTHGLSETGKLLGLSRATIYRRRARLQQVFRENGYAPVPAAARRAAHA